MMALRHRRMLRIFARLSDMPIRAFFYIHDLNVKGVYIDEYHNGFTTRIDI